MGKWGRSVRQIESLSLFIPTSTSCSRCLLSVCGEKVLQYTFKFVVGVSVNDNWDMKGLKFEKEFY